MGNRNRMDYNMEDTMRLMTKAPKKHKGVKVTLICLLVLLLLAGGGLAVWKYVLGNDISIGGMGKDPWIKVVEDFNEATNKADYEKKWEMAYPLFASYFNNKEEYLEFNSSGTSYDYKIKSIETVGNYSGWEEIEELFEMDSSGAFFEETLTNAIDRGVVNKADLTEINLVRTTEEHTQNGVPQTEVYLYFVGKIGNEWVICCLDVM